MKFRNLTFKLQWADTQRIAAYATKQKTKKEMGGQDDGKSLLTLLSFFSIFFFFFPEMDRIPSGMYFVQREWMGQPPSSKVKNNPAICTRHGSSSTLMWRRGMLLSLQLWIPPVMCSLWHMLVCCSNLELSLGRRSTCRHSVLLVFGTVCRLLLFYCRLGARCWIGQCLQWSIGSCRAWLGVGGIV